MNILIAKQLSLVSIIQQFQYPHFIAFNQFLSSLQGIIAVILLVTLFWIVDRKVGGRLLLLYFVAGMVTWLLKDSIHLVRPFVYEPSLGLGSASGNSFPSGDAFAATVVYGGLAVYFRKKFLYVLAVIIVSLVSYSRLALGVHYPTDVLSGILLGILLLTLQFKVIEKKYLQMKINKSLYFLVVIVAPLLMSLLYTDITPIVATAAFSGLSLLLRLNDNRQNPKHSLITGVMIVIVGIIITYFIYRELFSNKIIILEYKNTLGYLSGFLAGCWIGFYAYLIDKLASVMNKQ